jgi:hypothetical protein
MKFNEKQLAEIALIQEQRNLTRKSAVQFYTRQLKKQQPEAAKETKPKAAPEQQKKPGKPEKQEAPARVDSPTHHIELFPVAETSAYHTTLQKQGKAVVCFGERNRGSAAGRYNSVTLSEARYDAAQKAAKTLGLPLYIGLQVRVAGRWDSGWLIPVALFKQHKHGESDFSLGTQARIAYAGSDDALAGGVRFEIMEGK